MNSPASQRAAQSKDQGEYQSTAQSSAQAATQAPPVDAAAAVDYLTQPKRAQASPAERALLDQAERIDVYTGQRRLTAWRWGTRGPTVLLVHGWDSRASHLGGFVAALLSRNCQVVAFDAPGHGDSDGTRSNVVDIGRTILDVARQLGPFNAAIAHSVGSPASLYAFAHGMEVTSSVHLAGPSSLKRVLTRVGHLFQFPEDQRALLYQRMAEQIGASLDMMEIGNLAEGMRHPALLLHDPDDAEVPYAESVALQAAWPRSVLRPIHDVGHRRLIRESTVVEASVDFIDQQLQRPVR